MRTTVKVGSAKWHFAKLIEKIQALGGLEALKSPEFSGQIGMTIEGLTALGGHEEIVIHLNAPVETRDWRWMMKVEDYSYSL